MRKIWIVEISDKINADKEENEKETHINSWQFHKDPKDLSH